MKNIIVEHQQNAFDVSIQVYGTLDALFVLAMDNDLNITDDLQPAQALQYQQNKDAIAVYFAGKNYHPATADKGKEDFNLEGIDYWGIEIDFIVQ